jgi:hypothetical protein
MHKWDVAHKTRARVLKGRDCSHASRGWHELHFL